MLIEAYQDIVIKLIVGLNVYFNYIYLNQDYRLLYLLFMDVLISIYYVILYILHVMVKLKQILIKFYLLKINLIIIL